MCELKRTRCDYQIAKTLYDLAKQKSGLPPASLCVSLTQKYVSVSLTHLFNSHKFLWDLICIFRKKRTLKIG